MNPLKSVILQLSNDQPLVDMNILELGGAISVSLLHRHQVIEERMQKRRTALRRFHDRAFADSALPAIPEAWLPQNASGWGDVQLQPLPTCF